MFVRTEDLDRLVDKALDHAFASLGEGALVPFAIVEFTGETKILRIVGSGAIDQAKKQIAEWDPRPLRYAIAVEAKLTIDERSAAAILVEAGEAGAPKGGQWLNNFVRENGAIEKRERWFAKAIDNALVRTEVCPSCGAKLKP